MAREDLKTRWLGMVVMVGMVDTVGMVGMVGVVVHTMNSNDWNGQEGESLWVPDQPGYIVRLVSKTKQINKNKVDKN